MNIYALLSLCASAICIALGVSVYFLNRKSSLNKLFMLTMAINAYWAFSEFMLRQATTVEMAELWNKILFLWPFFVALTLHFTLAFTESNLLKSKLTYAAMYFPALLFSLIDLTTEWISTTPTQRFWGYTTTSPSYSVISSIDGVWAAAIALSTLLLYVNYYHRVNEKTRKQQTKFVVIGFAIPVCLSILTDSLFPVIGVDFPGLGTLSISLTGSFVAYAIVKYQLFSLSSQIAAENIFSTMADSIILVDLEGKIIKVNRSLVELSGYSEKELVGKSIRQIVQQAKVLNKENATPQIIAQLRKLREIRNYEITFYTKSGEKKTVSLSCSVVSNNTGQDVGATLVLHDITLRKEIEQKLIKAERFASIGELAGIIGHDLRNPLTGIRGATYYLKTKYASIIDSKDEAMFETIDKSIEYSNKIVNDLIDYSSDITLELETATPKSIVKSALTLIPTPANIEVSDETQEIPKFQIDVGKIRRSFVNIIKNAFDAMPNGGTLTIKNEIIGDSVVFSFKDTGQGMTQETLTKMWKPLFTTKAKGMGFGLAICKRNVEAYGGKINAESTPKRGTTILIELPLNLESQQKITAGLSR
jgi:PAS domain S-box-containing protein